MALSDEEPVLSTPKLDLERLSETELSERIASLKAEIAACEAELARKRQVREAADALFSRKS